MIIKPVKSVVWSAASQARERADAAARKARALTPAFDALAVMLPVEEFRDIYRQWEKGEREIRTENGYIMMAFTPMP